MLSILATESPPYQLGKVVGAISHLALGGFLERASELLVRYKDSIRDVDEICIELTRLGTTPPNTGSALEQLREGHSRETTTIVSETLSYLHARENPSEKDDEEQVRSLCGVWAKLARSSMFVDAFKALIKVDSAMSIDAALKTGRQVVDYWHIEVVPLFTPVRTGRLWETLARDRGHGSLRVEPLERLVSQIAQVVKQAPDGIGNPKGFKKTGRPWKNGADARC